MCLLKLTVVWGSLKPRDNHSTSSVDILLADFLKKDHQSALRLSNGGGEEG